MKHKKHHSKKHMHVMKQAMNRGISFNKRCAATRTGAVMATEPQAYGEQQDGVHTSWL